MFGFETEFHDFEFHIQYDEHNWYPLRDGRLPKKDPQGLANFGASARREYTDFDKDTPIGWRGPMILWNKIDNLPDVFWEEEDD
jgi:hypothetical protein